MLYRLPFTVALASALLLGACAAPPEVTRNASAPALETLPVAQQEASLRRQADDLAARTADILRKSTLRGAGLGAAAGCGIGLATGTGASRCVSNALAGGAVGAAVGYAQGQAEVAKRIEIVDPSPLVAGISKANAALDGVQTSLPGLLESQDAELVRLRISHEIGEITEAAYTKRLAEIAQTREQLAAALTLSSRQARDTVAALRAAQEQGQTGLDWHVFQAERLETEATSARSAITLL